MASSAVLNEAPIIEPSKLSQNCSPIYGVDPQPVGRIKSTYQGWLQVRVAMSSSTNTCRVDCAY